MEKKQETPLDVDEHSELVMFVTEIMYMYHVWHRQRQTTQQLKAVWSRTIRHKVFQRLYLIPEFLLCTFFSLFIYLK